mmetsp:Transcript_138182/g.240407  ORF Transcript_138182/g.240407 Transcript_138182/m.240407 type:complete len:211 (-) Transcript_138182:395-1027(-)
MVLHARADVLHGKGTTSDHAHLLPSAMVVVIIVANAIDDVTLESILTLINDFLGECQIARVHANRPDLHRILIATFLLLHVLVRFKLQLIGLIHVVLGRARNHCHFGHVCVHPAIRCDATAFGHFLEILTELLHARPRVFLGICRPEAELLLLVDVFQGVLQVVSTNLSLQPASFICLLPPRSASYLRPFVEKHKVLYAFQKKVHGCLQA